MKEENKKGWTPEGICLFQAVPRAGRMENAAERAAELGAEKIIPVRMKNCEVLLSAEEEEKAVRRWQEDAERGAEEAGRSRKPQVHPVVSFEEALDMIARCDVRIVPYENERGMAGTAGALAFLKPGQSVAVLIGPEGGFAPEEIAEAEKIMQRISLGSHVLRTDTAAICAVSLVMCALEAAEEK